MRGFASAIGAVALQAALVLANEWPNCVSTYLPSLAAQTYNRALLLTLQLQESDNCYRNFIDLRFKDLGEEFCVDFLAATTTAPEAVPTEFSNCDGDISAVSSACSCITYSISTTSDEVVPSTSVPEASSTEYSESSTTDEPSAPSSTEAPESSAASQVSSDEPIPSSSDFFESTGSLTLSASETSSEYSSASSIASEDASTYPSASSLPSSSDTASSVEYTTSTIYTTQIRTITACPPEKTDCPAGPVVTTEIIAISTTVCPVTESHPSKSLTTSKVYETGGPKPSYTHPYGTGSWAPSPTGSDEPFPTAGAGRVGAGLAAAFGALAVALL